MVRFYADGEHGGQFVGYRVAVSVNGKVKQKHYSLNDYTKEKAYELAVAKEEQWFEKQVYHQRNRVLSRSTNTGIVGLQFCFDKKSRCQKMQRLLRYTYYKNGEYTFKSLGFTKRDLTQDEWFEICRFIKNTRTLNDKMFEKILSKFPNSEKVTQIYDNMAEKLKLEIRDGGYYFPNLKDAA